MPGMNLSHLTGGRCKHFIETGIWSENRKKGDQDGHPFYLAGFSWLSAGDTADDNGQAQGDDDQREQN